MLLYYNVFFSIMHSCITGALFKHKELDGYYEGIMITSPYIFIMWMIAEIVRLNLGFLGNLTETVPSMTAFLFMSIFPQSFILTYFCFFQVIRFTYDYVSNFILLGFVIAELIFGYIAVKSIVNYKTARYAVENTEEHQGLLHDTGATKTTVAGAASYKQVADDDNEAVEKVHALRLHPPPPFNSNCASRHPYLH